jgi:hypothetical protein
MENVRRHRAMGSLCRQSAVLNPLNSWKLLGDTERWEHLAEVEIALHFKACNTTSSSDLAKSEATTDPNDTRWENCRRVSTVMRADWRLLSR